MGLSATIPRSAEAFDPLARRVLLPFAEINYTGMSENIAPAPKATLGLTGLTMNAMALIAPGAFLWLTYAQQCLYGQPMAGAAMWFGIVVALLLCLATAISYAELSKLYPGAGSSYFFAEQAFLSKGYSLRESRNSRWMGSHLIIGCIRV